MIRRIFGSILAVLLGITTGLILVVKLPFALGSMLRYRRIRNM